MMHYITLSKLQPTEIKTSEVTGELP